MSAISRDDIIASLNLDPSGTSASDQDKDRRIELALRACQRTQYYLPTLSATLDPDILQPWTFRRVGSGRAAAHSDEESLHKRFRMVNYGEASQNSFGVLIDCTPFSELRQASLLHQLRMVHKEDVAKLIRSSTCQTLVFIAMAAEENAAGSRCIIIQDKEHDESAICIRVADVRQIFDASSGTRSLDKGKINKGQPVLVVFYRHETSADVVNNHCSTLPWVRKVTNKRESAKRGMTQLRTVTADPTEQHMLLRALEGNAVRLKSGYTGPQGIGARWPEEDGWKISFLMPMAPMNAESIGRLQVAPQCSAEGCGEEAASLCGGCSISWFCSRDCQVSAWPTHKTICKGAADGPHYIVKHRWESKIFRVKLNVNDCVLDTAHAALAPVVREAVRTPVPDTHGSKRFAVKLQSQLDMTSLFDQTKSGPCMLNDPKREVEGSIFEEDCPDFAKIIKLMREKGRDSKRLFMYAQRVDDATLKLYHQDLPSQELRW